MVSEKSQLADQTRERRRSVAVLGGATSVKGEYTSAVMKKRGVKRAGDK